MVELTQTYITTIFQTEDSKSYSDFNIELPAKTINIPDATIAYINDIALPVSWTTTDVGNYKVDYSTSHYVNVGYDKSCWILPSDFKP